MPEYDPGPLKKEPAPAHPGQSGRKAVAIYPFKCKVFSVQDNGAFTAASSSPLRECFGTASVASEHVPKKTRRKVKENRKIATIDKA